jgi:hypothetical protein
VSFTYDFTNFPQLSLLRMMVGDTQDGPAPLPIFQDAEINAALNRYSAQGVIIALSGYTPAIPPNPNVFSFGQAAALLLNSIGATKARNLVQSLLDVKLNGQAAAKALTDLGQTYIDQEAAGGFFAVAEMVQNNFSMRERLWKMLYRQNC